MFKVPSGCLVPPGDAGAALCSCRGLARLRSPLAAASQSRTTRGAGEPEPSSGLRSRPATRRIASALWRARSALRALRRRRASRCSTRAAATWRSRSSRAHCSSRACLRRSAAVCRIRAATSRRADARSSGAGMASRSRPLRCDVGRTTTSNSSGRPCTLSGVPGEVQAMRSRGDVSLFFAAVNKRTCCSGVAGDGEESRLSLRKRTLLLPLMLPLLL